MSTLQDFFLGARPKTLSAAISPVIIGAALAWGHESFSFSVAIACLIVAIALQVAVNYANDYSDGVKGTDNNRVGPMRLVGSGKASPQAVLTATILSFLVAIVSGIYVASKSSWWLIAIGAVCIALAWFYTGTKYAFGYYGLGELVVFICFGLVATIGTYFALTGSISYQSIVASFIAGCFSVAILLANNIRDIETDTLASKKTLPVNIGLDNARYLFIFSIISIALAIVILSFSHIWILIALIPCLLGVEIIMKLYSAIVPQDYIQVLVATSRASIIVSIVVSVAIILS